MTVDMSTVSTSTPARWSSFSEKRTVLKAEGRTPSRAIRAERRAFVTRHTAAKRSMSARNSGESIRQVWVLVSVKGMPS